jgi:hypothetical protein
VRLAAPNTHIPLIPLPPAEGEETFDGAKECNSSDEEEDLRTEEHLLANLYQQLGMRLPETDYKARLLPTRQHQSVMAFVQVFD